MLRESGFMFPLVGACLAACVAAPTSTAPPAAPQSSSEPSRFCTSARRVDGRASFCEDFVDQKEGTVPPDWMGGDGLAIKQARGYRLLGAFEQRDEFKVSIPWHAGSDFRVDLMLQPDPGSLDWAHYRLQLGNLDLSLSARPPNMIDGATEVGLNASRTNIPYIGESRFLIALVREGPVCRVYVNTRQVLIARYEAAPVEGLTISASNVGTNFGVIGIAMTAAPDAPVAPDSTRDPVAIPEPAGASPQAIPPAAPTAPPPGSQGQP